MVFKKHHFLQLIQRNAIGFNNSGIYNLISVSIVTANYFDGTMSSLSFIDGTAYPASTFGSTDSVTGEWKINTSPSVLLMETNGFFYFKRW